jgi:hypothetical protein
LQQLAAELLATSKAIVMMDGNLSTLNMDIHAKRKAAMLAVLSKEVEKKRSYKRKKTRREVNRL